MIARMKCRIRWNLEARERASLFCWLQIVTELRQFRWHFGAKPPIQRDAIGWLELDYNRSSAKCSVFKEAVCKKSVQESIQIALMARLWLKREREIRERKSNSLSLQHCRFDEQGIAFRRQLRLPFGDKHCFKFFQLSVIFDERRNTSTNLTLLYRSM